MKRRRFHPLRSTPRKRVETELLLASDIADPILRKAGARKFQTLARLVGRLAHELGERLSTFQSLCRGLDASARAAQDGERVRGTLELLEAIAEEAAAHSAHTVTAADHILLAARLSNLLFDLSSLIEHDFETLDGLALLDAVVDLAILARWASDVLAKWRRGGD